MKDTVLVICAHPDDEILGAGGTIAKYTQEGKDVITVIFSYGEASHWWLKEKYTKEMRQKECLEAGKVVGTKETVFLGFADLKLSEEIKDKKNIKRLRDIIKKYDPKRIFTHSLDDAVYQDHVAVHNAVMQAVKGMHYKGDVYLFNVWGKDIRLSKNPKLYVDIKDTFKLKRQALSKFKSQTLALLQLMPTVYYKAIRYGLENRSRFAERFIKMEI